MIELFKESVTTRSDNYGVSFYATENNEVVANVTDSANQMLYQDVQLVDLSGRRTKVPGRIHAALRTASQLHLLERFKRICVARLHWSIGCFATL